MAQTGYSWQALHIFLCTAKFVKFLLDDSPCLKTKENKLLKWVTKLFHVNEQQVFIDKFYITCLIFFREWQNLAKFFLDMYPCSKSASFEEGDRHLLWTKDCVAGTNEQFLFSKFVSLGTGSQVGYRWMQSLGVWVSFCLLIFIFALWVYLTWELVDRLGCLSGVNTNKYNFVKDHPSWKNCSHVQETLFEWKQPDWSVLPILW